MLKITSGALGKMLSHCKEEKGETGDEACGCLVGKEGIITRAIPVENIHHSPSSYAMNSDAQMQIQKQTRAEGLEEIATYHSHVATEAYPSRRDLENAHFESYYVVVTLKDSMPRAKAFKIGDGCVLEEGDLVEV